MSSGLAIGTLPYNIFLFAQMCTLSIGGESTIGHSTPSRTQNWTGINVEK